jgi:hypothetical protein
MLIQYYCITLWCIPFAIQIVFSTSFAFPTRWFVFFSFIWSKKNSISLWYDEKTAEDNTKSGTQATSKKKTSTVTQQIRSTSRPAHKIPMVTLVPCPADTLIMFASLSKLSWFQINQS